MWNKTETKLQQNSCRTATKLFWLSFISVLLFQFHFTCATDFIVDDWRRSVNSGRANFLDFVSGKVCRGVLGSRKCNRLRYAINCGPQLLRITMTTVYKIAVMTFKVLHGTAPEYLGPVVRVADLPGRQALRSASTNCLVVPPYKLSTIGSRAFPVAGPLISGIVFQKKSPRHPRCWHFAEDWRLISLGNFLNILTSFIDFIVFLFL